MGSRQFITLNGVKYDAQTGVPLHQQVPKKAETAPVHTVTHEKKSEKTAHSKAATGSTLHRRQQKSVALKRNYVKRPTSQTPVHAEPRRTTGHVARSDSIVRFAPHPKVVKQVNDIVVAATPVKPSPRAQQAYRKIQNTNQSAAVVVGKLSAAEIKRGLLQEASVRVAKQPAKPVKTVFKKAMVEKKSAEKKVFKLSRTLAVMLSIALLGGYLTYINMPGLSVSIASAQAGVPATYPNYSPDGYRFSGPVEYKAGEVRLNFSANGGGKGYNIDQKVSGWNSVAVLDNLVAKDSNGQYEIEARNGITLYTYDSKVVWSNGGVLYVISSEAPLSRSQLLDIATSM